MRPSTEEFLYFLLWTAESLARPTWRNLSDPFETWAWRNGLGRRIAELERLQLVERAPGTRSELIVRLTPSGRRHAIGDRDPTESWNRVWDGRWRIVLFDISLRQTALRQRLWRYLRAEGYGFLQNSVWICPDAIDPRSVFVASKLPNVEALVLMEGRPHGGETDDAIVAGAWNFAAINRAYDCHRDFLARQPTAISRLNVRAWARRERALWRRAISLDPLLPRPLCPRGYLGFDAWKRRVEVIREMAALRPPAEPATGR